MNIKDHRVAACKLVRLTEETTERDRKIVDKEMRVHTALKHKNVLEFLNAVIVELKHKLTYVPGIYMLLELAGGGDLFDKIGVWRWVDHAYMLSLPLNLAADVGVADDVAQLYFKQLIDGMVYLLFRTVKPFLTVFAAIYTRARSVPSRSKARKFTSRCCRYTQNIRLRSVRRLPFERVG